MADSTIAVTVNIPQIEKKVTNAKFGNFLASEWKRLINPYTPRRDGILENNVTIKPFEIKYTSPYAHYMYTGVVYVDPITKKGGFTKNGIDFWSRPGVKKEASERRFDYRTDKNPHATDHWDTKAAEAGQTDKLVTEAEDYLNKQK